MTHKPIESVSVHYQTPAGVVAPHSYMVDIEMDFTTTALPIFMRIHYFGREDLPEGEIEAEGFTHDDDFEWRGELPFAWKNRLEINLTYVSLLEEAPDQLELVLRTDMNAKRGVPKPLTEWVTLTEQLTQACLEAGGKEEPMELVIGKLEKNNFYEQGRLVWYFADQQLVAETNRGQKQVFGQEVWEQSQAIIQHWLQEEAIENDLYQPPKAKGLYWLLNGSVWLNRTKEPRFQALAWLLEKVKL